MSDGESVVGRRYDARHRVSESNGRESARDCGPCGGGRRSTQSAVIAHDDEGLCWISHPHECDAGACNIDLNVFESRIYCWHPELVHPVTVDIPAAPTWLAISSTRIVFGASDGVWAVARPK